MKKEEVRKALDSTEKVTKYIVVPIFVILFGITFYYLGQEWTYMKVPQLFVVMLLFVLTWLVLELTYLRVIVDRYFEKK